MKPQGLPRALRVRSRKDFGRAFNSGTSIRDGLVIAYVLPNELPYSRVGLAVGKKGRTAPIRNRLRRILREAFRLERQDLPGGLDWILLVPRHVRELDLVRTRRSLLKVGRKVAAKLDAAPDAPA